MYILSKFYNPEGKNLITHKPHYLYYSRGKGDIIADPLDNIALINLKPGRYFVIVGDYEYKDLKKYLFKYAQIIKFVETTDKKSLFAEIIIKW